MLAAVWPGEAGPQQPAHAPPPCVDRRGDMPVAGRWYIPLFCRAMRRGGRGTPRPYKRGVMRPRSGTWAPRWGGSPRPVGVRRCLTRSARECRQRMPMGAAVRLPIVVRVAGHAELPRHRRGGQGAASPRHGCVGTCPAGDLCATVRRMRAQCVAGPAGREVSPRLDGRFGGRIDWGTDGSVVVTGRRAQKLPSRPIVCSSSTIRRSSAARACIRTIGSPCGSRKRTSTWSLASTSSEPL